MMDDIPVPKSFLEEIVAMKFPEETDERLQHLMDKNNEGELNEIERTEFKAYVRISELMSLLKARAYLLLGRRPK